MVTLACLHFYLPQPNFIAFTSKEIVSITVKVFILCCIEQHTVVLFTNYGVKKIFGKNNTKITENENTVQKIISLFLCSAKKF